MADPLVTFDVTDGLGRLTLQRPQAMNAVTPDLIADLKSAVQACGRSEAKALLISAAGPNFCVGADLKHFADKLDRAPAELADMADGFHQALSDLSTLLIPIVAAVQGHAVGAGFGLVLMGDVVVAAQNARFATGYSRLGLSADAGVSWSLTRALGVRKARSLLLTNRTITADEALSLDLVDQVVPDDELDASAEKIATGWLQGASPAYAHIKRLTAEALTADFTAHLAQERRSVIELAQAPAFAKALSAILVR